MKNSYKKFHIILTACLILATTCGCTNPLGNLTKTKINDVELIEVQNPDYTFTYKTSDGKIIFSNIGQLIFTDGIATIAKDGKYGLVNKLGEYIVEPIYDYIAEFHEGMCAFFIQDICNGVKIGYFNNKDEVLLRGVQGISDIITVPGTINVDFADVKNVMQASGSALMGIGRGQGEGRAIKAAEIAINSQLLETSINGASGVIVNITGGPDMTLHEITDAANIIHDAVLDDATVIIGTAVNENIQGEIQVTVIATGFELKNQPADAPKTDVKQLSASDFFSGAFNNGSNNVSAAQPRRSSMPQMGSGFTNIEIPDFLKK